MPCKLLFQSQDLLDKLVISALERFSSGVVACGMVESDCIDSRNAPARLPEQGQMNGARGLTLASIFPDRCRLEIEQPCKLCIAVAQIIKDEVQVWQMCRVRCSKHHPAFRMLNLGMPTVKGRSATSSLAFVIKHNIHRMMYY